MKKAMTRAPAAITVTAAPLWVSKDKAFAVVYAVFPEGMVRTLTRKTLVAASQIKADECMARPKTTAPAYAKVPMRLVNLEYNELGEIGP